MINIGSTNFLINVPSLPEEEFKQYSTNLFDEWEESVKQTLTLPDYSISLEIEEGSIKGGGKIAVALGGLYFGIGQYGDFISGLKTIHGQVSYVTAELFESARSPFGGKNAKARRSGGSLSRLHSLFEKVQKGTLTSDEAMIKAIIIFGKEAEENTEFICELQRQFENLPLHPEQLSLVSNEELCRYEDKPTEDTKTTPRKPQPKPIPQQYRIEIWRKSKKDKKHVKVIKL